MKTVKFEKEEKKKILTFFVSVLGVSVKLAVTIGVMHTSLKV